MLSIDHDDLICRITIDRPPVNALPQDTNLAVRRETREEIRSLYEVD